MARSAALNPASMPFFPGGVRGSDDEVMSSALAFGHYTFREQDRASTSSLSISPSEYRSVRSSPSPPQDSREEARHHPTPARPTQSPAFRQDAGGPYPVVEGRNLELRSAREGSMFGPLDTLPEDLPEARPKNGSETQTAGSSISPQQQRREFPTPPIVPNQDGSLVGSSHGGRSMSGGAVTSSSPVSSLGSGGQFTPSPDSLTFDARLKASPLLHDLLDRLVRNEYATQEIQRDLAEVQRKVNLLLERSLGMNAQPEFKDPFAPIANGSSFSPPLTSHPRPSLANIAPNQAAPGDDITSISQRLNTLTSSVGQLLAIQTQQLQLNVSDVRKNSVISLNSPQVDIAPNQMMSPPGMTSSTMLGHGLPHRPDLRPSPRQPPMRTWSAGTLDLPLRPTESNMNRQDSMLRDKRRSVSGLLRRDSSGMLESQGDNWAGGSPRESGPVISKWEQLALSPELLRSLGKFGLGPPNKIQQRALPFLLRGADIIAQAPPTQERIAAYVIPAIQVAVNNIAIRHRGPIVVMISTTVDQATQAQRMIRDLGGPISVRSALGVGTTSATSDLTQELRLLQQNMPHIICGTPQKLHALFTSPGGLSGSDVRFLVLDEVDQLIARNLHEFVFNIVKLLPPPRSRPLGNNTPNTNTSASATTPGTASQASFSSPFDTNAAASPFQTHRFSSVVSSPGSADSAVNSTSGQTIERQTALFSNTVPQDVLNLASAIQLREPVRVLVRRDGNVANTETTPGTRGLRQFYLYLAFTAGGRSDPMAAAPGGGLGIIGSGRGATSAETAQAREWKLDALADLFDDVEVSHAIVQVGGMTALDSVVYKLASRGLEAIPLHGDMNAGTKLAALNKFRGTNNVIMRQPTTKALVVYDVQVKGPDVSHIPLVINYDLPKAVEEYAHRVAPAIASSYSRAGVVVNFVTATGGDVEMLRSIECFYKIKCPEVPMSLRDIV